MDAKPGFAAFVWNNRYATGIAEVDEQHQQLVSMINRIGAVCAMEGQGQNVKSIMKELERYTLCHFSNEEKLMGEFALDAGHVERHCKAHEYFRQQVTKASAVIASAPDASGQLLAHLLEYLTNWLVHHIMGMDMRMAREIQALQAGASHGDAVIQASAAMEGSVDVLLDALNSLYAKLGEKTLEVMRKNQELELEHRALLKLNEQLDQRVRERTVELESANSQLLANNQQLQLLNEKIEAAHAQLLQSEKMASIGQLAAGVAHEINNPVGFVNSNLGTLGQYMADLGRVIAAYEQAERLGTGSLSQAVAEVRQAVDLPYLLEDAPKLLKESQDGLARVKRIISDLRDFSHVDESSWQFANLEYGMDSTLNVVWNEIKYKARVIKEYAGLPEVECMPSQINQVFLNLLMNAVQAIDGNGTITICTGMQGDEVWVEVADSGQGIPAEQVKRIFAPFFTTKPIGQGTGLGLSVSYGIVQKHSGRIEVDSTPGKGTALRVWLPQRQPVSDGNNPVQ